MFSNAARTPRALPRTGELKPGVLPTGGLNLRDAYLDMPPNDAVSLRSIISGAYGLAVRNGYQEWASNLPNNLPVSTLMSYYPAVAEQLSIEPSLYVTRQGQFSAQLPARAAVGNIPLSGQLFACTNLSIYDITAGGEGPWTPQGGVGPVTSDFWTWRNFQNAGGNFLLATNDEGGYVFYGGASFTSGFDTGFSTQDSGFSRVEEGQLPTQINGIDPDLFVYVSVWKGRVWFVEKDSSRAWYLPPAQFTGAAKQFDFGPQFRHGGFLVALVNWTIDGGIGVDDYLVAVGSEGDVVIYKGYDPDQAGTDPNAFQLHGIWYVGPLPKGRRQIDPYGGDVYVLSVMGVKQISKLVVTSGDEDQMVNNISAKIDPGITSVMNRVPSSLDYYIKVLPNENGLVVGMPETLSGEGVVQFYYATPKRAWSALYDLPVQFWVSHDHLTFAGTNRTGIGLGGAVYLMFENALDDVKLNPMDPDVNGNFILTRMIPAYSNFGTPGLWKTYSMVRPTLLIEQVPSISLTILTDFEFPNVAPVFSTSQLPVSLWDEALWNQAAWGAASRPLKKWHATKGGGYDATVQMDFFAQGGTRIVSHDWWLVSGGPL